MIKKRQDAVKSRSPEGDALSALVVRIFQLEGLLAEAGDAITSPLGQSTARWRVLAAIEHEPRTVAQIARDWKLARPSVQRLADALAADGLVTYLDNPTHRRANLARLAPDGPPVLRRIPSKQTARVQEAGAAIAAHA